MSNRFFEAVRLLCILKPESFVLDNRPFNYSKREYGSNGSFMHFVETEEFTYVHNSDNDSDC